MRIVIAGLAKTGTTGLFYKILNSMAGSPRKAFEPRRHESHPEDHERGVLAKILVGRPGYADYDSFDHYDRHVSIIRDPRDRLVSSLLYRTFGELYVLDDNKLERLLATLRQKQDDSCSVSVMEIAALHEELCGRPVKAKEAALQPFINPLVWAMQFQQDRPHYRIVKYEDFVSDRLDDLSDYLGFLVGTDASVESSVQRVVRTKGKGDWRNWFTADDVSVMRRDPRVAAYLEAFGYDDEWQLPVEPVILAEHCTDYVLRLVGEQRGRHDTAPARHPGNRPRS